MIKVTVKKVNVKVMPQKVTKNESHKLAVRHVSWAILHVDIDSVEHFTLRSSNLA